MARANVSIEELTGALKKSGLPFGEGQMMQQAGIGARQPIQQAVYGADQQIPEMKNKYMAQIQAIAQMDQKLAGVYGDPNSKLYIENPMARERAVYSPRQTGYQAASGITKQISSRKSALDNQVDDALSLYKQLTSQQIKAEKAKKKGSGAGKGVAGLKLTREQKVAGFKDVTAAEYWDSQPSEFQRWWVQKALEDPDNFIPDQGFSLQDVKSKQTMYDKTIGKRIADKKDKAAVEKSVKKSDYKKSITDEKKRSGASLF